MLYFLNVCNGSKIDSIYFSSDPNSHVFKSAFQCRSTSSRGKKISNATHSIFSMIVYFLVNTSVYFLYLATAHHVAA